MRNLTVAEQMVDVLRQAGVERIYGVVGDSLNPVVDAVRRADGHRVGARAQRGGRRLRGGGGGPADRQAGGVRGQLRARATRT